MLHSAVALESGRQALVEIWGAIARANALYFNRDGFSSAMERAIELADDDATRADLYADCAFQTIVRAGMWGPRRGQGRRRMGRTCTRPRDPESAARAKALIARCYSDYDKSRELANEASEIAERLGIRTSAPTATTSAGSERSPQATTRNRSSGTATSLACRGDRRP